MNQIIKDKDLNTLYQSSLTRLKNQTAIKSNTKPKKSVVKDIAEELKKKNSTERNTTPMNRSLTTANKKAKNQFTLDEDYVTYADRQPSDEFKKVKLLGKGGQAAVFQVTYKGENIALKQTSKTNNKKCKSDVDAAQNELDLHHQILEMFEPLKEMDERPDVITKGFSNVCKMKFNKADNRDIWIGQELGGDTLNNHLFNVKGAFHNGQRMYCIEHQPFQVDLCSDVRLLKDFLRNMLYSLQYFSKLRLVHADLKSENILIEQDAPSKTIKNLKIIDFGVSQMNSSKEVSQQSTHVATPEQSPPEHLVNDQNMLSKNLDHSHDIFSLGVLFLEIILGWPIGMSMKCKVPSLKDPTLEIITTGVFSANCRDKHKIREKQFRCIENIEYLFDNAMGIPELEISGRDLLKKFLKLDGAKRISPLEALRHPFLM